MRVTYVRGNKDHPRVYGENSGCCAYPLMMVGSPPRIRGKHPANPAIHDGTGITPAYTGKTARFFARCRGKWDHPRVYGENQETEAIVTHEQGSPPRIRGKHPANPAIHDGTGITPAYTGKTHARGTACKSYRDHPRVYGENAKASSIKIVFKGSPPRIRGKLFARRVHKPEDGITPAYTGKTRAF